MLTTRESFSLFQSTPLIRGETVLVVYVHNLSFISIHSPHTRGDSATPIPMGLPVDFNPLPSYEGRLLSLI